MKCRLKLLGVLQAVMFVSVFATAEESLPNPWKQGNGVLLLSFDDPHYEDWARCLPLFAKYGAHVSFFPFGNLDDAKLKVLKELKDAGHTVGTHTVGHVHVPDYVATHGERDFWERQVLPHLRAFEKAGMRVSAFAYPDSVRTDLTDSLLLRNGIRHVRGCGDGVHEITFYDKSGTRRTEWKPVADNPYAYNRRDALADCRTFFNVTVGEAYHTDIADICAAIRRASRENSVLQLTSHGISPGAGHIHMKTEWLEAILATAREVGMWMPGYDELPTACSEVTQVSPDGRNRITLRTDPLSYEIRRDGVPLVSMSRIGMTIDGVRLVAENLSPTVVERMRTGTEASPIYKKGLVDLRGNETLVGFGDWGVRLVARNDGVAYRFETMREGTIRVDSEIGEVVVADRDSDCVAHLSKRCGCEENPASFLKARDLVPPDGSPACLPIFLAAGGKALVMTEADVCDYPVAYLARAKREDGAISFSSVFAAYPAETYHAGKGNWDPQVPSKERGRWEIVKSNESYLVKTDGWRMFPWRAFLLADRPADLMSSDLVRALARPAAKGQDFSWVKPGKVTWEWWNAWDNVGDPIKGGADGCTTETYRRFFDLAAEHGVEYVIFDEGWSQTLDIWNLNENVDLKSLITYGNERGVGTILWMAWDQVVGDEEHVAHEFAKLGVKGFKVDFMNRGDAACERFYWDFAKACAKYKLVVDYHGAHRPTGLSRAYPNVLNFEGVHGLEQMKFYKGQDILANDVAICFTRMSAGPMDYTPGAMDNYPVGQYPSSKVKDIFTNPGSLGTRSRQMAMMVLYEAPLQMLCDSVKKYRANAECFKFMAATPVVWDDTVGLGGSPGTYAAVARHAKDGSWYVAAITNKEGRDIAIDTTFLGEGEWLTEIFRDALNADVAPTNYVHETGTSIIAGSKMKCHLAPGGGVVFHFFK